MKNGKKKGREINHGLVKNYFAWIANLGVVPLFLLAVFLLAPELFFLAALLLLVTHVLETILILLSQYNNILINYFKHSFLHMFGLSVNVIIATLLAMTPSYGLTNEQFEEDLILTKGEVKTIQLKPEYKYSISNKEILNTRFDSKQLRLTLRASRIGHTTINLINKIGEREEINIIVMAKSLDLKLTNISNQLKKFFIKSAIIGNSVQAFGEITNINDYFALRNIIKHNQEFILNQIKLTATQKNEILGLIYKELLNYNLDTIVCGFSNYDSFILDCRSPANLKIPENYLKNFEEKFSTKILPFLESDNSNYKVKFKILQLEQLSGEEIRLGLEQLNCTTEEILNSSVSKIISKNSIILKENNLMLNTLAEPMIVTQLEQDTIIQIGSEIPITRSSINQTERKLEWKFSGLKIKFKVEKIKDYFKVVYENELTKNDSESSQAISGTKSNSSIIIKSQKPIKLFDITIKTIAKSIDQFPYLSKIPVLGEIFKSKSNTDNYKTISAFMEISKNE